MHGDRRIKVMVRWFKEIFLGLVLFSAPALAQSPDPHVISAARNDVGFVIATDCSDGNDRTGTAFVWPQKDQVITARHVVAGCDRVTVQFRNHGRFNAVPIREIRPQDVVALQLNSQVDVAVQSLTDAPPPVHSKVAAVGFPLGSPTADDKLLTVTTGNLPPPALLKQLLPSVERQLIEANGPWDLNTAIIRLDGNLTHGHSGAPIFDHKGRVVAIGAGGLQSGATGIVWAVTASYLMDATRWTNIEVGSSINPENALTFSVQPPQTMLEQINCGGFQLSRSRTSSFQEMAVAIDDRPGLYKIQSAVGFGLPINFDAMQFDVWEDLRSGAVVPLPINSNLNQAHIGCIAEIGNGVSIWIRSLDRTDDLNSQQSIQNFSVNLEIDVANRLGPLFSDAQFTYSYPLSRSDGFVANRKGVVGPWIQIDAENSYQNYGFVTHVGRGGYYLGVAALRKESIVNVNLVHQCQLTGAEAACDRALPPLYDWAAAVISVHMSSMPPI